ncbi:ATP-binding protein [Phocaeicola barnesiae]|uniref:ATP-binding protein n=1 Tax=Phocaeicola barnesiae TaxID=376804 RepID=UPI0025A475B6|nr:ATP-binding protein [Phocaeicola barnesiae]MDM8256707.1 ATP-binding protein [Phocaeicola barnesiae]
METIGKIIATEKQPSTIEDFTFWTKKDLKLKPFDVVVVEHIQNSKTFGVVEEISHMTDSPSALAGYISSDFGEVDSIAYTDRIGMNYVKCKVVGNTDGIYIPVQEGKKVYLASECEIKMALGLDQVKNPIPAGYIKMYEGKNEQTLPVHFNSHFLIGPEGAHLNISGISGLASKTSYAMFLMKAIQDVSIKGKKESVAFIMMNVKGTDLLKIDQMNERQNELDAIRPVYEKLGMDMSAFKQVKYFYPYSKDYTAYTYEKEYVIKERLETKNAFQYKYLFETDEDKECLDLLFANVDDPNDTIESIINFIISNGGKFNGVESWEEFKSALYDQTQTSKTTGSGKEISVLSWRKFYRLFNKSFQKCRQMFTEQLGSDGRSVRLRDQIAKIQKNDVMVIDVAKLDEESQGFVFGDVMRAVYNLKLGSSERPDEDIPDRIIIFIDELNKYASNDVPKSSPILRQLLDITERGRSLGIVLFGAEQFVSDIHKRVKGNCATQAFGRTNAIEITKEDFRFVPPVYKTMLTRLKQGEYIIQNPVFRSMLNVNFPLPIYKYYD